ncbi:alpha/beta hydrolase [Streptomyces sp. NRRL S-340]|uniref:alpha/beta hydrolase n=1 Tax=Streptomyces sp. NRRL S-340 TaxID=1463901 RepID=UPI00056860FF|nr:alpha/beta hydrolase [Streptomyces sp. NRRL S-340]
MGTSSGMTWQQLRDLKLSELTDAADGWAGTSNFADHARESVEGDMTGKLTKTQDSESARSAVKRLKRLSENYRYIHTETGLIRGTLDGLAAELGSPQRRLRDALDDAANLGYTVNDNGSIEYPADGAVPGGSVMGDNGLIGVGNPGLYRDGNGMYDPALGPDAPVLKSPNPQRAKAQDIADRIATALREACDIDERYSSALDKLKAAPGLTVDIKTWANVGSDVDAVSGAAEKYLGKEIPFDKSPAERKEWWDHLSKEQREEYVAAFPEVVGSLDGVPALARDEANRENIQLLIAQLEGRDDAKSRSQLEGMKEIQRKLLEHDPKMPPMYLLGIGTEGNGRAIVAYGNPDTAKNVSTYVPGLNTSLDAGFAGGDLKRASDIAIDAQSFDASSASIAWLGYDAPQAGFDSNLPQNVSNFDVMGADKAESGATNYNQFMAGISATNDHADPHITAVGHSYGSFTVGQAAQRHGGIPGVDDIVLVGSPGTGADHAQDLNVGKNHVFVGAADNDLVTKLPSKAEAVALLGGPIPSYLADPSGDQLWFGTDPASHEFGANRFAVDDGPAPIIAGQGVTPAHSDYFNVNDDGGSRRPSESERNIALVVSGNSGEISREQPR